MARHSQLPTSGLDSSSQPLLDLLPLWTPGRGPLYRSLASALREAIQRGQFASGTRLPSERQLAQRLRISRTTVVAAYDVLREEDLVERRQGSGTHVRYRAQPSPASPTSGATYSLSRNTLFRRLTDGPDETIDLVAAYLVSPRGLPRAMLEGLEREVVEMSEGPGYAPLGHAPLRRAIASHMSRFGLPTQPDQVAGTSGGATGDSPGWHVDPPARRHRGGREPDVSRGAGCLHYRGCPTGLGEHGSDWRGRRSDRCARHAAESAAGVRDLDVPEPGLAA